MWLGCWRVKNRRPRPGPAASFRQQLPIRALTSPGGMGSGPRSFGGNPLLPPRPPRGGPGSPGGSRGGDTRSVVWMGRGWKWFLGRAQATQTSTGWSSTVQGATAAPGRRQTRARRPARATTPGQPRAAAPASAAGNRSRARASGRPSLGTCGREGGSAPATRALTGSGASPCLCPRAANPQARLARRLGSWFHSQPKALSELLLGSF